VPATGLFNFRPPSAFAPHLLQAVEHGWPAMVHANGDKAIDEVLQAYEHALNHPSAPPRPDCVGKRLRHRIEHASLLTDEHISQMAQLQLSPSFLIGHVGYWGHAFQQTILGDARAKLLDRCLSAKRAGLRVSLHSDHFVTPLGGLRMMEQAIFRAMEAAPEQAGAKPALNPAERLDRLSALRAVTLDAAWQCHMDHLVGSLEPGKLADLVVLEQDPLDPAVSNLRDIAVLQTWRSGAPVHLHAKLGCATEAAPPA
jgi:predicted amidohydrolase YtcJ